VDYRSPGGCQDWAMLATKSLIATSAFPGSAPYCGGPVSARQRQRLRICGVRLLKLGMVRASSTPRQSNVQPRREFLSTAWRAGCGCGIHDVGDLGQFGVAVNRVFLSRCCSRTRFMSSAWSMQEADEAAKLTLFFLLGVMIMYGDARSTRGGKEGLRRDDVGSTCRHPNPLARHCVANPPLRLLASRRRI
jgi:hypothetical protein